MTRKRSGGRADPGIHADSATEQKPKMFSDETPVRNSLSKIFFAQREPSRRPNHSLLERMLVLLNGVAVSIARPVIVEPRIIILGSEHNLSLSTRDTGVQISPARAFLILSEMTPFNDYHFACGAPGFLSQICLAAKPLEI